ncbi:unnamed protein product [marine sediment metagenome]|uniref:TRAM domain-containing protein n=1 Tax=marine sediment metagenome TaxID=412755 RepID=X1I3S4_9ZZZZ
MAGIQEKLVLGDKITVHTVRGRDDTVIGRLSDGRVVLFDQKSTFFNLLAPGQSVECHVIFIKENYVIVNPISEPVIVDPTSEPEEIEIVHLPEVEVDDIVEDLEKLIEKVSGNAQVIPKALLRIIQLDQLIIKILKGEA